MCQTWIEYILWVYKMKLDHWIHHVIIKGKFHYSTQYTSFTASYSTVYHWRSVTVSVGGRQCWWIEENMRWMQINHKADRPSGKRLCADCYPLSVRHVRHRQNQLEFKVYRSWLAGCLDKWVPFSIFPTFKDPGPNSPRKAKIIFHCMQQRHAVSQYCILYSRKDQSYSD